MDFGLESNFLFTRLVAKLRFTDTLFTLRKFTVDQELAKLELQRARRGAKIDRCFEQK